LAAAADIRAHGIDPSPTAISNGQRQFATLDLRVGTADQLFAENGSVDVLWYGFCLYLVDRPLLQTVVAEGDRVLRDGGLLVIHDFDPGKPRKRQYVHHDGLWSYKMDYSALFTANPAYCLVEKCSFSHAGVDWDPDPNERIGLWILRKSLESAYPLA
jgi:ubiquinone/menaquinone biosynthesis C-methylase UbiE